jgi:hypothetical protein
MILTMAEKVDNSLTAAYIGVDGEVRIMLKDIKGHRCSLCGEGGHVTTGCALYPVWRRLGHSRVQREGESGYCNEAQHM